MKKSLLRFAFGVVAFIGCLVLGGMAYLQHPKFGAMPQGDHLLAVEASPNYRHGKFRNLEDTPPFTDGGGFLSRVLGRGRTAAERLRPAGAMPSV